MNWISSYYLRYASLGFSVIPIKTLAYSIREQDHLERERDAKRPLVKWKEYQTKPASTELLFEWSRKWAHAGIGIVTGLLSDLIVIDDDRKGRPPLYGPRTPEQEEQYQMLLRRYGTLEKLALAYKMADEFCEALARLDTAISRTGKGHHYYFRLPRDIEGMPIAIGDSVKFLPGLDTRAEGGYVLAPPSIHPSGTAYVWENPPEDGILELPHWAHQAIEKMPNFLGYNLPTPNPKTELMQPVAERAWRLGQYGVGEGERNTTAASFIGKMLSECSDEMRWGDLFIDVVMPWNAKNKPPIGEMELRATWHSICNKEREKRGTRRKDLYQPMIFGAEPELVTARQIGIMNLHAPDFAVSNLIVDGTTQLFGKPKAGKSWLAMQIALAVALGRPLFTQTISMWAHANNPGGFETHQGDVLYLALEDSYLRLRDRMRMVLGSDELPERLTFATQWQNCHDGGLVRIEQWLNEVPHPRLVVADTVAAFMGDSSNSTKGGSVFRAEYRMFRPIWETSQRYKVPFLLVDHASKGKGKYGSQDPFDAGAGTLGSQAAVDTAMIMEHDDKGPYARLNMKGRDIERGFLELEHTKTSPVWKLREKPIEASEDEKGSKNGSKAGLTLEKVNK